MLVCSWLVVTPQVAAHIERDTHRRAAYVTPPDVHGVERANVRKQASETRRGVRLRAGVGLLVCVHGCLSALSSASCCMPFFMSSISICVVRFDASSNSCIAAVNCADA